MPNLVYPVPSFAPSALGERVIVDPDEVNAKFAAIARLVNGNLGVENLVGVAGLTTGMLANPRSMAPFAWRIDTVTHTYPANAILCRMKAAGRIRAVGVSGASTGTPFVANLKVNGGTVLSVASPLPVDDTFFLNLTTAPTFVLNDDIKLDVTAGSLVGTFTLYVSFGHST